MKITTRKSIAFACMLLVALIGQAETSVAKENKEILPPNSQQSTEVKGKVVDKSGNPIVGATIAVKGTGKGVATLNNGTFTLKIGPNDKVLIVSFVGMKSVEIAACIVTGKQIGRAHV